MRNLDFGANAVLPTWPSRVNDTVILIPSTLRNNRLELLFVRRYWRPRSVKSQEEDTHAV
jgi:hypothetical protein